MMKIVFVVLAVLASMATAQYLVGGEYAYSAPSIHAPWASSVNTGIRRYGSTAGYVTGGYYAAAPVAAAAYYV